MKLINPRAELALFEKQTHATASSASFSPRTSQKEAEEAKDAAPRRENPKNAALGARVETPNFRYGKNVRGWPKT